MTYKVRCHTRQGSISRSLFVGGGGGKCYVSKSAALEITSVTCTKERLTTLKVVKNEGGVEKYGNNNTNIYNINIQGGP